MSLWDGRPCGCGTCGWCFYLAQVKDAHDALVSALKERTVKACTLDCQPEDVIDPNDRNSFHTLGCHEARAALEATEEEYLP